MVQVAGRLRVVRVFVSKSTLRLLTRPQKISHGYILSSMTRTGTTVPGKAIYQHSTAQRFGNLLDSAIRVYTFTTCLKNSEYSITGS